MSGDAFPGADGTGDPRVDEAVAALDRLATLPTSEHVSVLDDVHRRLRDCLADLDGS